MLAPAVAVALLVFAFVALPFARGAEVIPPAPKNHFNDYARMVRPETATQLNRELAQFERDSSTQLVVAIFPRMQSPSSVEDYTVRVAQAWRVGQAERRNGAVLFVFQETRDIRIVTGYGLEGALPDALAKRIIESEIIPRFRAGDFDGGMTAGVRAMIAATRGEYRGTGALAADAGGRSSGFGFGGIIFLIILLLMVSSMSRRSRRGAMYGPRGRRTMGGPWGPWGGGGFGGGGFGGGGGGGTFSGGGGSFGGGGAGGRW